MREPTASQIIAGKYRLESLIGHGGMGSVWRARHATLDMPVAIKFMAPQALADAESRQRFDREARALAALRTPHIVQVIDFGVDEDTPYIVMELLEGEDLSTRLAQRRRLSLDEVSRILAQVARALRRAHEAGITHRDLKPSNIFLARIDDEEIIKVLDFGVAKLAQAGLLTDDALTKAGTLLGSPGYMSPEQARGKEVDFRSDLWALSVIVFRAVTGVKPFAGDSIAELVIKLCIDPRPIPTRCAPDLPPAVDRFFEKAFAAAPEDRFQSAVEMAAAFAAMLGQPSLELSQAGPSPVAGISPSWRDGPPPAAPAPQVFVPPPPPATPARGLPPVPRPPPRASAPSLAHGPQPAPSASASVPSAAPPQLITIGPPTAPSPPAVQQDATVVGFPLPGSTVSSPQPPVADAPAQRLPSPALTAPFPPELPPLPPGVGKTTVVLPSPPGSREPTPTPASFGGFAPSGAEASVPPARGPSVPPPVLVPPPVGLPEGQAPSDMFLQRPTVPAMPPAPVRPQVDPKVLVIATAGAALLAIVVSLAIAALRGGSGEPHPADDDIGSALASASAVEPAPAPSAAAPADTPGATTDTPGATTETPGTATDMPSATPSASASVDEPTLPPPTAAPTPTPKPVYTAPKPKPKPTSTTKPKPKPTSTAKYYPKYYPKPGTR